jgi:hypothetical protein
LEAFHQIEQADNALAGHLILDPRKVKIVEEWLHGPYFELPESHYIRASNLPIAPPAEAVHLAREAFLGFVKSSTISDEGVPTGSRNINARSPTSDT